MYIEHLIVRIYSNTPSFALIETPQYYENRLIAHGNEIQLILDIDTSNFIRTPSMVFNLMYHVLC